MADSHPRLTNLTSDAQLISIWLADKRRATKESYAVTIRHFFTFIGGKGL